MTDLRPFATMRGMEILVYLRDALLDEAARKRFFIDECERHAGGRTDLALRQRICALEAAADAFTHLVGVGQDELTRIAGNPGHKFPDWLTRLANQARGALIEPEPDVEDLAG
jgi:hypothetical protein